MTVDPLIWCTSSQVMKQGYIAMNPQKSNNRQFGSLRMSRLQQKPKQKDGNHFFGITGLVSIMALEDRRTVNSE